ncbi:hypothetical protein ABID21_002663 [Pseudorhizobium tarimense]|uniref:Uncharacterized protein n=1 Tax=Pseudorhizobium tarimense TaxID=1079109 RepID=A0ABV2H7M7_9HYPH
MSFGRRLAWLRNPFYIRPETLLRPTPLELGCAASI